MVNIYLLECKEVLIESSDSGQHHQQCLLNQRVSAGGVLEDVSAEVVKVSQHELATGVAGDELELHPLASGIARDKPGKTADSSSSRREKRTYIRKVIHNVIL